MVTLAHTTFMDIAIEQALKAYQNNEVPVGAVIVSADDHILSKAYNKTEQLHSQSRHAEVLAIEKAGKKIGDWRLVDCTIYVTLEPCLMCLSLIGLSRISKIVYGATSPLFGYDFGNHLDKEVLPALYQKHIKEIIRGVRSEKVSLLMKRFFKDRREKE